MSANKVIIAGSKGLIGTAIVKHLLKKRFKVIELDLTLGHDLTNEEFVKDFFKKNKANVLINLFALNDHVDVNRTSSKLFDITLDNFRMYQEINVVTLFSVCREFARNNETGSIINFTSTYGIVSPNPILYSGDEKNIGYGVSKAAVIQLTRHLAIHLAPHYRVNCIMPGGVEHNQTKEFKEKYARITPLGRMMKVNELFGIIEYLISDSSSYSTGGVFSVDGGYTAW